MFTSLDASVVLDRLQRELSTAKEEPIRYAVLRGLKKHGTEGTVTLLESYVKDEGNSVDARAEAKRTLDAIRARLKK